MESSLRWAISRKFGRDGSKMKKKLAIVGAGKLGSIVANAAKDGYLPDYELVGIMGRTFDRTKALADEMGCKAYEALDELLAEKIDYLVEVASVAFVKENALNILSHGTNMIIVSIGALSDAAFYSEVSETAKKAGTKLYIASGAVGGFDVLRTISLMGEAKESFETKKGPESLRNTPLFKDELLTSGEAVHVFDGTASEAIKILPTKVNVSIAASLAGSAPEKTKMDIYSVPDFIGDDHKITSEIDGVKAVIDIYSSTAAIAGWSVVSKLINIASPIEF